MLTTPTDVIEALGGTRAVAELTGRSYKAAFQWRYLKNLPANTFVTMQAALRERELAAPASLWGMADE